MRKQQAEKGEEEEEKKKTPFLALISRVKFCACVCVCVCVCVCEAENRCQTWKKYVVIVVVVRRTGRTITGRGKWQDFCPYKSKDAGCC